MRKAAVVVIALLVPLLFVGNGLYLLTHGWFVRAEYARPGFPPDELGMKTPERTRLAIVGLHSIVPWHRDGTDRLREARLDDGSVAFDAHELRHMSDVRRLLGILLALHAVALVALIVLASAANDPAARAERPLDGLAHHARARRVRRVAADRQPGVVPHRLPHDLLQGLELALRRRRDAATPVP